MADRTQLASWEVRDEVGTCVLVVRGELDMTTANAFGDAGVRLVTELPDGMRPVIDLSGVTFIDSTGLRALLRTRSLAPETLVLRSPTWAVRRLLDVAVPGVFTIE